jgi:hypothetical protein
MKHALLLAFIFAVTAFVRPYGDGMTATERKLLVEDFQRTKDRLLNDVKGLSAGQLNFKADTSRWSIAQCIEHIALAESAIWQWQRGVLQQPADPSKRSEIKVTDEQIEKGIVDRSHKFKAPEMLQPIGKFPSAEAALQAYTSRRDSTIAYLKTTQDDLRDHVTVHPALGSVDGYQLLLFLAGHSERHTLQIEEVKASPGFPKQ